MRSFETHLVLGVLLRVRLEGLGVRGPGVDHLRAPEDERGDERERGGHVPERQGRRGPHASADGADGEGGRGVEDGGEGEGEGDEEHGDAVEPSREPLVEPGPEEELEVGGCYEGDREGEEAEEEEEACWLEPEVAGGHGGDGVGCGEKARGLRQERGRRGGYMHSGIEAGMLEADRRLASEDGAEFVRLTV